MYIERYYIVRYVHSTVRAGLLRKDAAGCCCWLPEAATAASLAGLPRASGRLGAAGAAAILSLSLFLSLSSFALSRRIGPA
jgi:hypothetical protein